MLTNIPNQAETLLHSLERAATGIGLYANAHKTEYMCYNQTGDISTLDRTPLKLVDKFTYLGSSASSSKKDIDTRLTIGKNAERRSEISVLPARHDDDDDISYIGPKIRPRYGYVEHTKTFILHRNPKNTKLVQVRNFYLPF